MSADDMIRRGDADSALAEMWRASAGDFALQMSDARKAIAALPAVTVGVRPLVWDAPVKFPAGHKLEHMTACRTYKVVEWPDGSGHVLWFGQAGRQTRIDADAAAIGVDALKAAAQAHHDAAILAALEPQPAHDAAAIREATARLHKLAYWLDTDAEVLADMDQRDLSDHQHIQAEVNAILALLPKGGA